MRTIALERRSLCRPHKHHSSWPVLAFSDRRFPLPQSSRRCKCGFNLPKSSQNNFKWVCVGSFQSSKILFHIYTLSTGKLWCVYVFLNGAILCITFCILLFPSETFFELYPCWHIQIQLIPFNCRRTLLHANKPILLSYAPIEGYLGYLQCSAITNDASQITWYKSISVYIFEDLKSWHFKS